MAFTRNQAKQQQQQQRQYQPQNTNTNTNTNKTYCTYTPIDFIDASIEWRKNKIKRENCTFQYKHI
jgi:hypothetical protein